MFFTGNYWGQDDPNPKPSPPSQVAMALEKAKATLADPRADEIAKSVADAFIRQHTEYQAPEGYVGQEMAQPNNMLGSAKMGMIIPKVNNPPSPGMTPMSAGSIADLFKGVLSAGTEAARPKLGSGMGSAGKGILGAFGQVAQDVIGAANKPPETVEEMYRRLMFEYSPQYTGPSADQMAQEEFAPQFQMLADIVKQQKGRYDTNAPKIVDLYRALNDSAVKGRGDNAAMYDQTIAGSKAINAEAGKSLQDRYAQALASQSEQYKNLGIEDAAPTVFADQAKTLNDNQAALSGQGQIFQNLNNSLKGNQYAYDTSNIGIQKQAGNQAQQDFLQSYLDQVAQTDMQRLQLQGQQQQAENQYAGQISQMLSGAAKDTGTFVNSMIGNILGDRQAQARNEVDQANAMNSQDRLAFEMSRGSQQKLNPYDALQQNAASVLGNPTAARQFSDILLEAYLRHPGAQNVGQLMEAVGEDTLRSNPAYTSLAFDFFSKMLASQR